MDKGQSEKFDLISEIEDFVRRTDCQAAPLLFSEKIDVGTGFEHPAEEFFEKQKILLTYYHIGIVKYKSMRGEMRLPKKSYKQYHDDKNGKTKYGREKSRFNPLLESVAKNVFDKYSGEIPPPILPLGEYD